MSKKIIFSTLWVIMLTFPAFVIAQKASVSGKLTDNDGLEVIGATVYIEGTTTGSITGIDGKYNISGIEPGTVTLVFSYVGYRTERREVQLTANQKLNLNIILKIDALELEQVVVVGYGRRQKRDVTGSIETIRAKELADAVVPSFEQAIQGRAAGVQVTAANGVAGSPVKVNVRGTSSISAGSEPLYVIDGIPVTSGDFSPGNLGSRTNALADLNPNDIESIEILKDAAAAAIYGSRGANGVVIITTKRGVAGKTKFNASYMAGMVTETNRLELLDATQHLALRDSARVRRGLSPEDPNTAIYGSWTRRQADSLAALGGTNWLDQALRTGKLQEANLSVSGGNDKTIFYIAGTYRKEDGFLVGNSYERINGRVNLENKANDKLTIGSNVGLTYSVNNRVPIGDAGGLGDAQRLFPYIPITDENGEYFYPQIGGYPANAVWVLENTSFVANTFRTVSNVFADYQFNPYLSYRSELGLDVLNQLESEYNFRNIQDPLSVSSAWDRRTSVFNWTTNNYFGYTRQFNKIHDLDFTLGNAIQRSNIKGVGLNGWDFPSDFFTQPNAAEAVNQSGYSYISGYSFISNFFRTNYKLRNKYLLSFSIRSDGSSRFGMENRYGWFPALSGGWILTDENFIQNLLYGEEKNEQQLKKEILTFLKLRASYGLTGNANIGDFAYLGVYYPSGGYAGYSGIVPGTLTNPELGWERSAQADVTLDYGLLENKISGTITYYHKKTTDMLLYVSLPPSSGYSSIIKNVGSMNNQGWEFTLSTKNLNKKIKWSTDFNIAFNRNKVTDVLGLPPDAFESGEPGEGRVLVGYPVGQAYVVRYAGVAQQAENIQVYDVNGNPVYGTDGNPQTITTTPGQDLYYDKYGNIMVASYYDENGIYRTNADFYEHRVACGKPVPDFVGGITNTFTWKGFDFSFMFSFVYGNTLYDDPAKNQIGAYDRIAQRPEILDAWTPNNTDTDVPALEWGKNPVNSDRFLYDASFLRLRSVSFGYRLPKEKCEKLKLNNLRIFVRGANLWTLTKYPGWDPEVLRNVDPNSQQGNISFAGPSLQTPQAKSIIVGIQIEF